MLSVYVVDDEPAARDMLVYFLNQEEDVKVVGFADEPLVAIEEINDLKPDFVLLDIQMPELSGIEMIPYLKHKPMVVFCTAYDEYALEAFRVKAVDYLLKPISEEDLKKAITRCKLEWEKLLALKLNEVRMPGLQRIVCSMGRNYNIVWLADVRLLYKEENYINIIDKNGASHITELAINYIEDQAELPELFRINRGLMIHRAVIKGFHSISGGRVMLETDLDERNELSHLMPLTVSRRRTSEFRKWLKL